MRWIEMKFVICKTSTRTFYYSHGQVSSLWADRGDNEEFDFENRG